MTIFGGEGVAVEDTDWIRSITLKISLGTDFSITHILFTLDGTIIY